MLAGVLIPDCTIHTINKSQSEKNPGLRQLQAVCGDDAHLKS